MKKTTPQPRQWLYLQAKESLPEDTWSRPVMPRDMPPLRDLFPEADGPLEVEIGCGKGKFLLARAQALPEGRFLGIDYALKWLRVGVRRAEKKQLHNLRFVRADAWLVLERYLPAESVSVFHVYFPDPWHKRRHQKRRLLTADFFHLLRDRLKNGGLVEIATDNPAYFEYIRAQAASVSGEWSRIRETVNQRIWGQEFKTNYELKYEAEERPLYYMELVK